MSDESPQLPAVYLENVVLAVPPPLSPPAYHAVVVHCTLKHIMLQNRAEGLCLATGTSCLLHFVQTHGSLLSAYQTLSSAECLQSS